MSIVNRLGEIGIVPVVVFDQIETVISTAHALRDGGIPVMEVTLRTNAGLMAIEQAAKQCGDMIVGAGTVLTCEQCKEAVDKGAQFIVTPGFDYDVVKWCMDNNVTVVPGCVTPTEIMAALKMGLNILKFFPANIMGGIGGIKSLAGPFGNVKFIPTGGVSVGNLAEYAASPYVHAVGGSWICSRDDIVAHEYEKITRLAHAAVECMLGFEMKHIGINQQTEAATLAVAGEFSGLFGFLMKDGKNSTFAGNSIEVVKGNGLGENGHIAIQTNSVARAIAYIKGKGFEFNESSAKYKNGKIVAIYLENQIGGFAVHLIQK